MPLFFVVRCMGVGITIVYLSYIYGIFIVYLSYIYCML